ncbi:amidohydrolase [Photobacterium minamisatsumaniensis]|uniref:amidohydrolase n=1 Tax=Photobacterium minamisatsumaniensis TaxID=2910233 RepID=UPI003D0D07C3
MKNRLKAALLLSSMVIITACNFNRGSSNTETADTIFYNGNIITMDDEQRIESAIAIKGGEIIAVGTEEELKRYTSASTVKINLESASLVPGFIDAHGHMSMVAQSINHANLAPSPIGNSDSISELVKEMQLFWQDRELAPEQWVTGMGYDDSLLAERTHPTRFDLDQISTEVPIVIMHVSGHLAVINSKALQVLEIDENTPDPDGGKIVRIEGGNEPNGVLEETAMYLAMVGFTSAPQDMPSTIQLFSDAQQYYASFGITTVQDGAASAESIKLYETLANDNVLYLDVVAYPTWDVLTMLKLGNYDISDEYHNNFRVGGVKIILDGSPQGKTAYMTQPYLNPPAGEATSYVGYPTLTTDFLEQKLSAYLKSGTQFIVHTNGDAAVDMYLDALDEIVNETQDMSLIRPVSIHSQTTRDDQLERMLDYHMIPSFFSAHTFFWGDWHRDEVFGVERAERISPTRSASNYGIQYTTHNDSPVVDPDMIRLMYNTVNRVTRSGETLGEEQKATAYESLASITRNAAYQYHEEQRKGSLERGKIADMVILSGNPLTIKPEEINSIQVLETFKQGKSVYKK